MAGNQLLFLKLAEALGQPSRAYRAAKAGLDIPNQALEGYEKGSDLNDKFQTRKFERQTLSEALGGNVPDSVSGYRDLSVKQFKPTAELLGGVAALEKAGQEKQQKYQQGSFLVNGRLVRFEPISGQYEYADSPGGKADAPSSSGTITGTPTITPRVPPAVPAEQVNKNAELAKMLNDISVARSTYKKDYVGPIDARKQALSQVVDMPSIGLGASPNAAIFKSTVAGMRNKVLNLLSGAAISPAEGKRLMDQLPNENRSDVDFNAVMDNFEREVQSQLQNRQASFSQAGYRPSGGEPIPSQAGPRQFGSEEEAEASGYKGPAIIAGKRAVIH